MSEQLESCDGRGDDTTCSYQGVPDGTCFGGVCLPAGCGNNKVEEGEVCDDGNRFPTDGCSADCKSEEVCGNGIIDGFVGEACDDGKHCQALCGDETPCESDADCEHLGEEAKCIPGDSCEEESECATIGDGKCMPRGGDLCQANCASPTCGDGVIDSKYNEVCDDGDGNSDEADGACRTNCQPQRCGDGITDYGLGETCDDKNLYPGDGCSGSCQEEVCGNGIVDLEPVGGGFLPSEECDDGENGLNHDGCGNQCRLELPRWGRVLEPPSGRSGHAMAYDAARGRIVLFGGFSGASPTWVHFNDTWEWDGSTWTNVTPADPAESPTARGFHRMVYDAARGRVVLFGGTTATFAILGDTWEWNGRTWSEVTPSAPTDSPPPRRSFAMAYDAGEKRTVLFGGQSDGGNLDDTWAWNGTAWTDITPTDPPESPTERSDATMTYDAARGKLVLFGGYVAGPVGPVHDTWEWNGTSWTDETPANPDDSPPGSSDAQMAYDSARGRVVLVLWDDGPWEWDGEKWSQVSIDRPPRRSNFAVAYDATRGRLVFFAGIYGSSEQFGDSWEWDGLEWHDVTPLPEPAQTSPPERLRGALAFDATRSRLILFGGYDQSNGDIFGDTWEWDGSEWTNMTPTDPADSPSPRAASAMVYDASRSLTVLVGGEDEQGFLDDTWEWNGSTWTQRNTVGAPGWRGEHAVAYDSARSRVVLFGGIDDSFSFSNETWEYNGTTWSNKTPASPDDSPSARVAHALAYSGGKVVLFGGFDGNDTGDMWEWNGAVWSPLSPSGDVPSPRRYHGLCYDSVRDRTVLYGGLGANDVQGDTWEYNGTSWTEVTPSDSAELAPARWGHLMVCDSATGSATFFGGGGAGEINNDIWQWDGAAWSERTPLNLAPVPTERVRHAMAYDSARARVVLFGGSFGGNRRQDTWEWDGSAWTRRFPATQPTRRRSHAMAYDAARQKTVLFGGGDYGGVAADTWVWDGGDWTKLSPAAPPAARWAHAMAYDASRERVVLFGGVDSEGNVLDDTWEWNGVAWTEAHPATSPPARAFHALAFDASRGRTVLFSGCLDVSCASRGVDTWEWDGTTWVEAQPPVSPPARSYYAMLYDAARARTVILGGRGATLLNDAWEWDGTTWQALSPTKSDDTPFAWWFHAAAYHALRSAGFVFGGVEADSSDYVHDSRTFQHAGAGTENCTTGFDGDGDGLVGCDDPDCWGRCTPQCPPYSTDNWPTDCEPAQAHCGDGVCNQYLEDARLCPLDNCDPIVPACGDFHCDAPEDMASCPGDCTP